MMISTVLVKKAKVEVCCCEWMLLWCWSLLGLEMLPLLLPIPFIFPFSVNQSFYPFPLYICLLFYMKVSLTLLSFQHFLYFGRLIIETLLMED